jgi:8-oxo-dGTP pyrophosphatase MutT (NUDIX family)
MKAFPGGQMEGPMGRTKPDAWYEQSAVVPFRRGERGLEVLLITTRGSGRWIVPKGIVEPHLTPQASAAQEAFEEAGVRGEVEDRCLGEYAATKWGGKVRIRVYPMRVAQQLDQYPEAHERRRRWVDVPTAVEMVRDEALGEILRSLE